MIEVEGEFDIHLQWINIIMKRISGCRESEPKYPLLCLDFCGSVTLFDENYNFPDKITIHDLATGMPYAILLRALTDFETGERNPIPLFQQILISLNKLGFTPADECSPEGLSNGEVKMHTALLLVFEWAIVDKSLTIDAICKDLKRLPRSFYILQERPDFLDDAISLWLSKFPTSHIVPEIQNLQPDTFSGQHVAFILSRMYPKLITKDSISVGPSLTESMISHNWDLVKPISDDLMMFIPPRQQLSTQLFDVFIADIFAATRPNAKKYVILDREPPPKIEIKLPPPSPKSKPQPVVKPEPKPQQQEKPKKKIIKKKKPKKEEKPKEEPQKEPEPEPKQEEETEQIQKESDPQQKDLESTTKQDDPEPTAPIQEQTNNNSMPKEENDNKNNSPKQYQSDIERRPKSQSSDGAKPKQNGASNDDGFLMHQHKMKQPSSIEIDDDNHQSNDSSDNIPSPKAKHSKPKKKAHSERYNDNYDSTSESFLSDHHRSGRKRRRKPGHYHSDYDDGRGMGTMLPSRLRTGGIDPFEAGRFIDDAENFSLQAQRLALEASRMKLNQAQQTLSRTFNGTMDDPMNQSRMMMNQTLPASFMPTQQIPDDLLRRTNRQMDSDSLESDSDMSFGNPENAALAMCIKKKYRKGKLGGFSEDDIKKMVAALKELNKLPPVFQTEENLERCIEDQYGKGADQKHVKDVKDALLSILRRASVDNESIPKLLLEVAGQMFNKLPLFSKATQVMDEDSESNKSLNTDLNVDESGKNVQGVPEEGILLKPPIEPIDEETQCMISQDEEAERIKQEKLEQERIERERIEQEEKEKQEQALIEKIEAQIREKLERENEEKERLRKEEEERRIKEEEDRKRQEEEERKRQEEERLRIEEEERLKKEEEERKRKEEEDEQRRKEEERIRKEKEDELSKVVLLSTGVHRETQTSKEEQLNMESLELFNQNPDYEHDQTIQSELQSLASQYSLPTKTFVPSYSKGFDINTLKTFRCPQTVPNLPVINNLLKFTLLSSEVVAGLRKKLLLLCEGFPNERIVCLISSLENKLRGIYLLEGEEDKIVKVWGKGPACIMGEDIGKFYNYETGAKSLRQIPVKHYTQTTDAVALKRSLEPQNW